MSRSTKRRSQETGPRRVAAVVAASLAALVLATSGMSATLPPAMAAVSTTNPTPASKALDYLASCQRSDGGFAEKSASSSSESLTAWTIVALASAGQDANLWKSGGHSPVEYLATKSSKWASVTDYARTALAARAAGRDVRSFGGVDLIAKIRAQKVDHGAAGDSFGPYVNTHTWALIALEACGETITTREIDWLVAQQNSDGGWGWAPGQASDTNDTAAAIQALMKYGKAKDSDPVKRGLAYLESKQQGDAGFSYSSGASDSNSSAWVIQAMIATGKDPTTTWKRGSASPMSALASLQRTDGSFGYTAASTSNPLLSTVQAIPALCWAPFPLKGSSTSGTFSAKPVVALQSPSPGSTVVSSTSMTLKLSVSDAAGTGVDSATLKVKVDGKTAKTKLTGTSASVGPVAVAAGTHTVAVTVADHAGNAVSGQEFKFTVASASTYSSTAPAGYSSTFTTRGVNPTSFSRSSSVTASASVVGTAQPDEESSETMTAAAPKRRSTAPYVAAVVVAASLLMGAVWGVVWWIRRKRAG